MNQSNKTFGEKLLEMEKPNTAYKEQFEIQLQTVLEKRLNYAGRIGLAILGVAGLLIAIPCGHMVFLTRVGGELDLFVHIVYLSGMVLALSWAILMGWVAVRGKLNLRIQLSLIVTISIALGFFFMLDFTGRFVLPLARDENKSIFGTLLVLIGFFFIVTFVLCLILRVLYRTAFKTYEKLLEIEYRLAELAEKIEDKSNK
jgi:hypothetical protein